MPLLSTIGAAAARAFGFLRSLVAGYNVANSLRFNSGSSDKLEKALTGTDGNRQIWTFSSWVKRAKLGTAQTIFSFSENTSAEGQLYFDANDFLVLLNDFQNGSSNETDMVFRDVGAWYHIVWACDSTQATNANRWKVYVNGTQVTLTGSPAITLNGNGIINAWASHDCWIGANARSQQSGNPTQYADIYLSETYFIDGQQKLASDFGETDTNTGIWKPKAYTGTFGTRGFYLNFANSADLGNDVSGNNNDFTASNLTSVDQSIDTPTNNFATLNPNMKSTNDVVLTEGNLKMVSNFASGWQNAGSTFAVRSGKWYWEAKATVVSATDKTSIGVIEFDTTQVDFIGNTNKDLAAFGISGHGAGTGGYTYAQGDIIMCAMDVTNNKVYWGKNGTFYGTLNPAAGTGTVTQTINNNNFCMPVVGGYGGSTWELNFGFPQFTIASGNADANGFGNFEYAVPSGFYALCSKNLAEFG